jgi:hypothetical protein
VAEIWRAIGLGAFGAAFAALRACERELKALAATAD